MVDYMEILRLSSDPKNSQRCIASIVHSSRHTIRDVLEAAKKAGVSWPLDDTVTNEMLKQNGKIVVKSKGAESPQIQHFWKVTINQNICRT